MSKLSLSVEPKRKQAATSIVANVDTALAAAGTDVRQVRALEELAEAGKRYAQTHEQRVEATIAKLKIARRGGRLLIDMADKGERSDGGRPETNPTPGLVSKPTLDELGLSANRSSRWQRIARIPDAEFIGLQEHIRSEDADRDLPHGVDEWEPTDGLMSSNTPEWYTPHHIIERVVEALGGVDLDPCSNRYGEPRVPAAEHYRENGLDRPWRGRVYMNPPYGKTIGAWVDKLAEEFEYGNVTEAIALVPARPDTAWWAHLPASVVCFVTGRLAFSDSPTPAPFPSAALYLGGRQREFAETFMDIGNVWVRLEAGG